MVYEAIRNISTTTVEIQTPITVTSGIRIQESPLIVPVLRAGLGMLDAAHTLLPEAEVGFIGVSRNEDTFQPEPYLNTVPDNLQGRAVLVLEPMLATGGSLAYVCSQLMAAGAGEITVVCVIAAPQGITTVESAAPDTKLVVAAIDADLNQQAYIVPGLGDAGDRQFGDL